MLLLLVERSTDISLLLQITSVVAGWVSAPLPSAGGAPSAGLLPKERANFVLKMSAFERLPSPELHAAFLRIRERGALVAGSPGDDFRGRFSILLSGDKRTRPLDFCGGLGARTGGGVQRHPLRARMIRSGGFSFECDHGRRHVTPP